MGYFESKLDFAYIYGYVAYLLTWHDELNTKSSFLSHINNKVTKNGQKWPKIAQNSYEMDYF